MKAFGAYRKNRNVHFIETCASKDYFIRRGNEGTPLGPVTERFFDEHIKGKTNPQ